MSNRENIISLANPKRAAIFGVAVAIFTALIVYKLDVVVTLAAVLAVGILALILPIPKLRPCWSFLSCIQTWPWCWPNITMCPLRSPLILSS